MSTTSASSKILHSSEEGRERVEGGEHHGDVWEERNEMDDEAEHSRGSYIDEGAFKHLERGKKDHCNEDR